MEEIIIKSLGNIGMYFTQNSFEQIFNRIIFENFLEFTLPPTQTSNQGRVDGNLGKL